MSDTRGVSSSGGTSGQADPTEAQRRELEEAVRAAEAREATTRPAILRHYMPLPNASGDALLRAFTEKARKPLPPVLADLRLYTDDVLDREVNAARARLGSRSGPEADGERLFLGKLEDEHVRRVTPPMMDVDALAPGEVDAALAMERAFLARHGSALAPTIRKERGTYLRALELRREGNGFDARACQGARPVAATLRGGVGRIDFTADDLVATLKREMTLTPEREAQVRATFERWHREACLRTGEDPTVLVSRERHAEARIDDAARDRETMRMRLEMLEASRMSALAALAFVDSAERGESVEGAHARVRAAAALGTLAMTVPIPPPRLVTEAARAEVRDSRTAPMESTEGIAR